MDLGFALVLAGLGLCLFVRRRQGAALLAFLVATPVVGGVLLAGGVFGLRPVPTVDWGGLMLNVVLSFVAVGFAIPLGILLAFGRRSRLPLLRWGSTALIEFWRGVPLLSVLFMGLVLLPLVLPAGVTVDNLVRALVVLTLCASAYAAEVVRGGLQALPKGQYEAADALGLSYWQKTGFIILPQALRLVIPPLVNTFIGFFKDTSLVLIIGIFDLLTAGKTAIIEPA